MVHSVLIRQTKQLYSAINCYLTCVHKMQFSNATTNFIILAWTVKQLKWVNWSPDCKTILSWIFINWSQVILLTEKLIKCSYMQALYSLCVIQFFTIELTYIYMCFFFRFTCIKVYYENLFWRRIKLYIEFSTVTRRLLVHNKLFILPAVTLPLSEVLYFYGYINAGLWKSCYGWKYFICSGCNIVHGYRRYFLIFIAQWLSSYFSQT